MQMAKKHMKRCSTSLVFMCMHAKSFQSSPTFLIVTLWTLAHQVPLSIGFSRQEYRNGLLCPQPGDLPDLGIKTMFFTTSAAWEVLWSLGKCWSKLQWDTTSYPLRLLLLNKNKYREDNTGWPGCRKTEHVYTVNGGIKCNSCCGIQTGVSSEM